MPSSSELRQNLISGDWIIVAPGRDARPKFLDVKRPARKPTPKKNCSFEESNLRATDQWPPLAAIPNVKKWNTIVLPNRYPALAPSPTCSVVLHDGIYAGRSGVGRHDLIITRDHHKNFAELTPRHAQEVFTLFQKLCKESVADPCTLYAVPFWNWGLLAGASVWHPHYQFLSLPVIPAHSARSLVGAKSYFKKNHRCAQCDIIRFEKKQKGSPRNRIIAENASAIALAPYASKFPFEVRVMPKRHHAFFHATKPDAIHGMVILLQEVFHRLKKHLHDPDYNVFIHEAPLDGKPHEYHHWHIEIIPRVSTPAGFELSTGVYINSTAPETVAEILRHA